MAGRHRLLVRGGGDGPLLLRLSQRLKPHATMICS